MRTEELLEQINSAVDDWETGPDAVRFNAPADVCEVCGVDHSTLPIDGHQGSLDDSAVIAVGFAVSELSPYVAALREDIRELAGLIDTEAVVFIPMGTFRFETLQDREARDLEETVAGWQMPAPGTISMTVTIDVDPFGSTLLDLFYGTDLRTLYGRRNLDPVTDWWQSDLCAAWIHGSCPLPGRCDCTCHAKAAGR